VTPDYLSGLLPFARSLVFLFAFNFREQSEPRLEHPRIDVRVHRSDAPRLPVKVHSQGTTTYVDEGPLAVICALAF
jgi:hypothetical protein